jgi:hypothetical protein
MRSELSGRGADFSAVSDALTTLTNEERHVISYFVRKMGEANKIPYLTSYDLEPLKRSLRPVTAAEASDNLIRHLGQSKEPLGIFVTLAEDQELPYMIGVESLRGIQYLINELHNAKLVNAEFNPILKANLTFAGWSRFGELVRGAHSGRSASMAMKFGEPKLEHVFDNCLKSAVDKTGYDIRPVNHPQHQQAGLIDDRLRVAIKSARFVIADLTHNNNGAYWEAGYGEGLGKPVIYTCDKSVFDQRKGGTHFDTNHHLTILWDLDNLERTAQARA